MEKPFQNWPVFELPVAEDNGLAHVFDISHHDKTLQLSLHDENVSWFCNLRYLFIATIAVLGVISLFPKFVTWFGFWPQPIWPFIISAFLFLCNFFYKWFPGPAKLNLLIQMLVDLIVLTFVVHFVGSTETYISLMYLFHIILACLFFSPINALIVLAFSYGLYSTCLLLEYFEVIEPSSIYLDTSYTDFFSLNGSLIFVNSVTSLMVWLSIWYLTTRITNSIRERDRVLNENNKTLIKMQKEKTEHMLRTTHELKAPFAAIQANAQLLVGGLLGPLEPDVKEIVTKILVRCQRLTRTIVEMLQLSNLQSETNAGKKFISLDLIPILKHSIALVQPIAETRQVKIKTSFIPCYVWGIKDHLEMLFNNLIANAVNYSFDKRHVEVVIENIDENEVKIMIRDQGIGVESEKIDKIFNQHYRTKAALKHNADSSGLGLSLVKHVSMTHRVKLKVYSKVAEGTVVILKLIRAHYYK